jgi:hypothetical protein
LLSDHTRRHTLASRLHALGVSQAAEQVATVVTGSPGSAGPS